MRSLLMHGLLLGALLSSAAWAEDEGLMPHDAAPFVCFESPCTDAAPAPDGEDADLAADGVDDPFGGEVDPFAYGDDWEYDNSGVLDGIYQCTMAFTADGQSQAQVYVSVNGKRNGDAVFIIGEIEARPDAFYGWGIGRVEDETDGTTFRFSGKTSENERFELTATFQEDDSVRAQGQAVIMFRPPGGQPIDVLARLDCRSIW